MKKILGLKIIAKVLYALVYTISLLPLPCLYVLADFIYWLMYYVAGYRKTVVTANLQSSFPQKSSEEIKKISKQFYHFLADYFVETIKLASISKHQIIKRMSFIGTEDVANDLMEGRTVSLYLGHYCNWEWVSSLPIYFPKDAKCGQIYHPLEDKVSDAIFLKLRSHFYATSIRMRDTLKVLSGWYRQGEASVTGYIADQVPNYNDIHCWLPFLNHDTPVYSGAERISKMFHAKVYYIDLKRIKRGYYEGEFIKISDDASTEEKFVLTRKYFAQLEKTICRAPQYWLWSHRRWKRTREKFMQEFSNADSRLKRL